jgi:hypothetical protein
VGASPEKSWKRPRSNVVKAKEEHNETIQAGAKSSVRGQPIPIECQIQFKGVRENLKFLVLFP